MDSEPALVIAFDIGTTYSGYACQFRDTYKTNPHDIWMNNRWGIAATTNKTTTCVLYRVDGTVTAIGYRAEQTFAKECDKERGEAAEKYFFFKHFKMVLYQERSEGENYLPEVEDYFGRKKSIFEVMSKFILGLKNDCMERFSKQRNLSLDEEMIRWVITVPAIWDEKAKNIMRKCAEKAGIPGDQLLLALEPETAAIHCMHLPEQERRGMHGLGSVGDTFMIVDLGGGTVDITAVEVLEGSRLREIIAANGGPWGGQYINENFFKLCKMHFKKSDGTSIFDDLSKAQLLKMEFEIEKQKINLNDDILSDETAGEELVELGLPHDLRQRFRSLIKTEGSENPDVFYVKPDGCYFKLKILHKIIVEDILKKLISHLKKIMQNTQVKEIKKIVLVGGFAESPLVLQEISRELPEKKVVVPTNPTYAVLKGAILYGQNPDIFKSRISRYTYGIKVREVFDPSRHNIEKLVKTDDMEFCKDIFSIHVSKGQVISIDNKQPTQVYHPVSMEQKAGSVRIYISDAENPVYVTDESCKQIGTLIVPMPDTTGGTSRDIEITMIYGGTEIRIEAVDKTSGKRVKTDIKFEGASL
ncbi:hypothetical protein CHS0354_014958 [Potamilus streckersoni]|uniref:Uncharacterized protein n=1 Tax=Potamilus streckersoni TaxID=2493646 RepID=A0AAE0VQQ1_9BIVA|nr:hypothetical protein CHS0354_014958 [Potamilus streckersoni]